MTAHERRHSPRRPVDWAGQYRLEEDTTWRGCRVVDISETGAAIETHELVAPEAPSGPIHIRLGTAGVRPEGIRLHGEIRNLALTPEGRGRIGFEFSGLSPADEGFVALLLDLVDTDTRMP